MKTDTYNNILIIKPSALGDIVHALPVLPSLRAAFPEAKLTWLVRKEFAPLLECTEGLDEVLLFDRKGMRNWFYNPKGFKIFWDFAKQLRSEKFDVVLDLQGLSRSAMFTRFTGCDTRVGMIESRELAHLIYTHLVKPPAESVHILDYYFSVLETIGVSNPVSTIKLTAPEADRQSIQNKLNAHHLNENKFLVLIPGSAHAFKCWPTDRFAEVAKLVYQEHRWPAVVVGTKNESHYAKAIADTTASPVIDLTGQTSIPELVALFDAASAVVSNDTGPGHIALATNSSGVVIFGNTNPLRLGPYQQLECVVAIDPDKRGAEIKDANPAHHIENITVKMVLDKLEAQFIK